MTFNWGDYLKLARALEEDTDSRLREARLRTAISRAYYSIFIEARNALRERGISIPKRDMHKFVWKETKRLDRKLAEDGKRLRGFRNNADYDDTVRGLAKQTHASLRLAGSCHEKLSDLQ